jgi:hypothetical protein
MANVYHASFDKVKVFSEFERPNVVIGFEYIPVRTIDQKILLTNNTWDYCISSPLSKAWLDFTEQNRYLKLSTVYNSAPYYINITFPIGFGFSPYYIAHFISQQIKPYNMWCDIINNKFVIYATNIQYDGVQVITTPNNASSSLGFSLNESFEKTFTNSYNDNVSLSGLYTGIDTDTYWVKVSGESSYTITPGTNNVYNGTLYVAGNFDSSSSITYTISIDTTDGNIANNSVGFLPKFSVSSTSDDDTPVDCFILCYDTWYEIGNKGVRIKFSEYPFGNADSFQIDCQTPLTADGTNTQANEEDVKFIILTEESSSAPTTLSTGNILTLPKGIELTFDNGTYTKGDTFVVKVFAGNYSDVAQFNMGAIEIGATTFLYGVRLIAKQGAFGFKSCKVAISSLGDIVDYGYSKSEFEIGTIGKVKQKNTNELPTEDTFIGSLLQFSHKLNFWDLEHYIDIGCGNPIYATDPWFLSFVSGADESTTVVYPKLKLGYTIR